MLAQGKDVGPDDLPALRLFWEVLGGFTPEQQGQVLKFVTSCSRPPLLGFRYLEPRLGIHVLDGSTKERLPTAATCLNLLKLPPYRDKRTMREKLLLAVSAGAGFELS